MMKNLQLFSKSKLLLFICFFLLLSVNAQFPDSLALFIVADANALNVADSTIASKLEDEMLFDLVIISQGDVTFDDAEEASLVLISATVTSDAVAGNIPDLFSLEVPVINWEPYLDDELGYGPDNIGGEFAATEIYIEDAEHPIAAGISEGVVTISNSEKQISYGIPEGEVDVIAVNVDPDSGHQAVVFAYEVDAEMYEEICPARRVGLFLLNDVADDMTDDGWAIFDAAVEWAMADPYATAIKDLNSNIATTFTLYNNYPNPFNATTNIKFSIPSQENVCLSVWSALGEKVATLVNGTRSSGDHMITFNANDLSSGVYFYKLEVGRQIITKKMLLLK